MEEKCMENLELMHDTEALVYCSDNDTVSRCIRRLMSKGEKGVLYIPYYLAYGDRQAGDKIQPYSNLMFEVELVDFE